MDWYDVKEFLCFILLILLVAGILTAGVFTVGCIYTRHRCDTLSTLSVDYEFGWGITTGCLVRMPNGFWVDVNGAGYIMLEQIDGLQ